MTRKHFRAIALTLWSTKADWLTCTTMADTLEGLNPNFDRSRFLKACTTGVM